MKNEKFSEKSERCITLGDILPYQKGISQKNNKIHKEQLNKEKVNWKTKENF